MLSLFARTASALSYQMHFYLGIDPEWIWRGGRYLVIDHGESMGGAHIHDGDTVVLAPVGEDEIEFNSEMVYAILAWRDQECEGCILKYLLNCNGVVVAVPASPIFKPVPLSDLGDRVEVFGKVVG